MRYKKINLSTVRSPIPVVVLSISVRRANWIQGRLCHRGSIKMHRSKEVPYRLAMPTPYASELWRRLGHYQRMKRNPTKVSLEGLETPLS